MLLSFRSRAIAGVSLLVCAAGLFGCSGDGAKEGACSPSLEFNGTTYVERPTAELERSDEIESTALSVCSDVSAAGTGEERKTIRVLRLKGVDPRIAIASANPGPGGGIYVVEGHCYGFSNADAVRRCIANPLLFEGRSYVRSRLSSALATDHRVGVATIGSQRVPVWKLTDLPVGYALAISQSPKEVYVEVNRCNLPSGAPDFEADLIRCLSAKPG